MQFIDGKTLYDTYEQGSVVRHIHATLDEERFQRAKVGKGDDRTWEEAIMEEIAVAADREDTDGSV